jgi:DNA mismatch endonuclease (patch repair protein)
MSRVRSKNTGPEIAVRRLLHGLGYRFRLHRSDLPGKPDIVLPKYKTVVFVHGCFWHRHVGCKKTTTPKSRLEFWADKFERNIERDKRNRRFLTKLGWRVLVVWQCEARSPNRLARKVKRFLIQPS